MSRVLTILAIFVSLAAARPARGQDFADVEARVSYLTADYVYLDVGRDQGIQQGDTLAVIVGGQEIGRLVVRSTASARSLTVPAGPPLDVAVGDLVTVRRRIAGRPAEPGDVRPVTAGERPSLLGSGGGSERARRSTPTRISGRVRLGGSARSTATDSGPFDASARSFATSNASLRLAAADLPGGWDAVLDARLSHRVSSNSIVGSDGQVRFYRASVVRSRYGSPLEIEAGRFQLRQDAARSTWDGLRAGWRSGTVSAGLAVGLEPDAWNGTVQTDVPKAAGYTEVLLRPGAWRVSTTLTAVHVRPTTEWLDHTYVGVRQEFRAGDVRVGGEVLVDRNPERSAWNVTRFSARATVPLATGIELSARHYERTPYMYWRSSEVLGTRRRRESVSLALSRGSASAVVTWTSNTAAASARSTAWSASGRLAETPLFRVGFSLGSSWWSQPGTESRFHTARLFRRFGSTRVDLSWRHYEFESGIRTIRSESARIMVMAAVSRHFRLDGSGQVDFGDVATGLSMGLGMAYSF